MAYRKDMRRADLIIPYEAPTASSSPSDMTSTLTNTLPMAAMFTRNKYIGWGSLVFAVQNWLGESAESKKAASQPAIFSVGMAGMALMVTYLPMFLPPPAARGGPAPAAA